MSPGGFVCKEFEKKEIIEMNKINREDLLKRVILHQASTIEFLGLCSDLQQGFIDENEFVLKSKTLATTFDREMNDDELTDAIDYLDKLSGVDFTTLCKAQILGVDPCRIEAVSQKENSK
jgi:hypothetical protein